MKLNLLLFALSCVVPFVMSYQAAAQESPHPTTAPAHTRTEFHFTVDAPYEQTAPLFGANEERKWARGWDPQFIYPLPAHDEPGMVFQVAHGPLTSTWVNTAFDLAGGHIQYAYVLGDAMATMIDIHLMRESAQKTSVTVVYERTALAPEANDHVEHFTKGDQKAGQEWQDEINAYFAKVRGAARR